MPDLGDHEQAMRSAGLGDHEQAMKAAASGGGSPPTQTTLISFRDGSYKKVRAVSWKHSQWIHFTLSDGSTVAANPANVNYLHIGCGD